MTNSIGTVQIYINKKEVQIKTTQQLHIIVFFSSQNSDQFLALSESTSIHKSSLSAMAGKQYKFWER